MPEAPPLLSVSQRRILDAIRRFMREHQCSPSVRDIARIASRANSTVKYHLDRLEQKGVIAREPRTSRTIRLLSDYDHNPNTEAER